MIVLAHAGHWAAGLLYMMPVLAVALVVGYQWWRGRRESRSDARPDQDTR